MDDRVPVELVHCGDDALLEFLFRCDADVTQDGAGKLRKEALNEIEPGAVLGREGELEAASGLLGEPSFGFLRNVRIRTTGDIIALSPPLIIARAEIDQIVETLS